MYNISKYIIHFTNWFRLYLFTIYFVIHLLYICSFSGAGAFFTTSFLKTLFTRCNDNTRHITKHRYTYYSSFSYITLQ